LSGLTAKAGQILRLAGFEKEKFPRFYSQAAGELRPPLTYAGRILREGDQGPVLPLTLSAEPPRVQSTALVSWSGGPTLAEMRAAFKCEGGDFSFLECDVPSQVDVSAVTGGDVREWSSLSLPGGGHRLQVWLKKTVRATAIEVRGGVTVPRLNLPERR